MGASALLDTLLAVGVNHHTAPIEVRERLAMDSDTVCRQLDTLVGQGLCSEAMLLCTCNRVELYAMPVAPTEQGLLDWFAAFRTPGGGQVERYLFWKRGREAVSHLFRVASSLDSMVVGEPQILGQVKEAVRLAEHSESLGTVLQPLSRRTLAVAKKVRSKTTIGRFRVGIGNAGVDLATQIFGDLNTRRALLIGTGEMGTQVARALQRGGLQELLVANRTHAHAVQVAEQHGATPVAYDRIEESLSRVDIAITATASPQAILTKPQLRRVMRARRYRPLCLVDLAVPRNIDPQVADLDEAYLFNVDDLSNVMEQGRMAREQASVQAKQLVEVEVDGFVRSMAESAINPRIGALTKHLESLRQRELLRSARLVQSLSDQQSKDLDALTQSLVRKVLHVPLRRLRAAARQGDLAQVEQLLSLLQEQDPK